MLFWVVWNSFSQILLEIYQFSAVFIVVIEIIPLKRTTSKSMGSEVKVNENSEKKAPRLYNEHRVLLTMFEGFIRGPGITLQKPIKCIVTIRTKKVTAQTFYGTSNVICTCNLHVKIMTLAS